MKRSTEGILTTHVGSLVKPADLQEMFAAKQAGQPVDESQLAERVKSAIRDVVGKQVETGIDVVNDGELSKSSWAAYFGERLTNVEVRPVEGMPGRNIYIRDEREFPQWFEGARLAGGPSAASDVLRALTRARGQNAYMISQSICTGPLRYIGREQVQTDIDNLKAAAAGLEPGELCMTALAPPTMAYFLRDEHYGNPDDFVLAVSEAMADEYRAITDAGILLQLDEPALATMWHVHPDYSVEQYRRWMEVNVEAINVALRGIPEDRVRMHTCWGSVHHPHRADIPLEQIVDLILRTNVGAYSLEASNPLHDADWHVWEDVRLPEGKTLIPGVIGHYSDYIEHPHVVRDRLLRYAAVVGKENVIAGVDCGLGSRVGHESIMWAKFESMVEGARLASEQLWR